MGVIRFCGKYTIMGKIENACENVAGTAEFEQQNLNIK